MKLNFGQYSKLIAGVAGLALTILTQKYGSASWLPYVVAAAGAYGIYGVSNTPKTTQQTQQTSPPPPAPIQSTGTMRLPGLSVQQPQGDFESTPVQSSPAPVPASQAGTETIATETANKVT